MNTSCSPREFALVLLLRSPCLNQVAAVLSDHHGIFAWGWNNPGDGMGMHAEEFAFKRANRRRLRGATLTVAARKRKTQKLILARPCKEKCMKLAEKHGIKIIEYTAKDGKWTPLELGYYPKK